jgi:hypothetical protein
MGKKMRFSRVIVVVWGMTLCTLSASITLAQQTPAPVKIETTSVGNHVTEDLQFARPPVVLSAEAHAGRPYGIARVNYRLQPGDEMIARTGAVLVTETDSRLSFPVIASTPFRKFIGNFIRPNAGNASESKSVWFLFKGDQPLNVTLHGSGQSNFQIPIVFDKPKRYERFAKNWWNNFSSASQSMVESGDYPPMVETYLTELVGKRLGLAPPQRPKTSPDSLARTFELLFDVESLRIEGIHNAMTSGVDRALATLPMPPPIQWTPLLVDNLPADIEIEPLAQAVPRECFYLRFGTWQNQIWLQKLTEEFGGNLSRMIQLRGYQPRIQSKFLDQLAIQSTEFDRLFGGSLIDDVGVIGMDSYFDNGAAIGVLLHARNTKSLANNLRSKRKKFTKAHAEQNATVQKISTQDGETIELLSTPDNRYRSFYAVSGDNHLLTTSRRIAERFLEAAGGQGSLAQTREFQFARYQMPVDRDDTLFVYLPTRFFQQLLTPAYQIELQRRNQVVTDMMLNEMAKLLAAGEAFEFKSVQDLIGAGYLPQDFGSHPDGSSFETIGDQWQCSIRGRRGFFIPIADMQINRVTELERQWFTERAEFFSQNIKSLDPMMIAVKRYQEENNLERVVFDARVLPFGEDKYKWLLQRMGPPLKQEVRSSPDDIVRFEASIQGGISGGPAETHHLFGAVQDYLDPNIDLKPKSFLRLVETFRQTPGYVGAWPNPGYTDWMPQLGGQPDAFGYTYSRLLRLWRLQWADFSVLAFDQQRLETLKQHLGIVPCPRPAQVRVDIGDLAHSKIQVWANTINFRRSWQASIANIQLLNLLNQQFRTPPAETAKVASRLLDVDLVCSLDGQYQRLALPTGREVWYSDAWPSFSNPQLPAGYLAPVLKWFRGLELEVIKEETQFSVHGILDVQRSDQTQGLPSFDLFKGFGRLLGK